MLVDFTVANFASFNEAQTLTMVMPQDKTSYNKTEFLDFPYLSNIAAIYGANGAGKSNLIKAFEFCKKFINESAKKYSQGDKINVTPFSFDPISPNDPSEFAISFIHKDYFFEYGFELDSKKVHKEYLYATPPNSDKQQWLLRENNIITIGDMVKGTAEQKQLWKDTTRDNALFLSTAIMLNSEDFSIINNFLLYTSISDTTDHIPKLYPYVTLINLFFGYDKKEIMSFLLQCGVAFYDFEIRNNNNQIIDYRKDAMSEEDERKIIHGVNTKIFLKYSINNKEYALPFEAESDGTRQLFHFSGIIIEVLKNGSVWIADELHRSLHPKAFEFVIKLFQNPVTNPKNAQLIFTSHDTHPMKFLEKHDVWIAHKNTESKQTELYSISDFKNVPDTIDIQKEYLDDIFGGLPNITG